MKENWKSIEGYENIYQISDLGRIKSSHRRNKSGFIKPTLSKGPRKGYLWVTLQFDGKRIDRPVHLLVAHAFLGPKPFPTAEINHIDFNKLNNCAVNLEWVSHAENMRHAFKHHAGIHKSAMNFGYRTQILNSKLTKAQVLRIKELFKLIPRPTDQSIAIQFGVCRENITRIRLHKSWSWLTDTHSQVPQRL